MRRLLTRDWRLHRQDGPAAQPVQKAAGEVTGKAREVLGLPVELDDRLPVGKVELRRAGKAVAERKAS